MPVVAIVWNTVFILAAWETARKLKKIGFGEIRFLTGNKKTAYLLMLLGVTLGAGMLVVAAYSIIGGTTDDFCRRCFKDSFSYTSSPLSYLIIVVAQIECSLVMFFIALLARNSLRFIRGNT